MNKPAALILIALAAALTPPTAADVSDDLVRLARAATCEELPTLFTARELSNLGDLHLERAAIEALVPRLPAPSAEARGDLEAFVAAAKSIRKRGDLVEVELLNELTFTTERGRLRTETHVALRIERVEERVVLSDVQGVHVSQGILGASVKRIEVWEASTPEGAQAMATVVVDAGILGERELTLQIPPTTEGCASGPVTSLLRGRRLTGLRPTHPTSNPGKATLGPARTATQSDRRAGLSQRLGS